MCKVLKYILLLSLTGVQMFAQNEAKKWYFGTNAGLDFMTSPPTILTNGSMVTSEGCASISDGAGNLLFYTSGAIIWDQTHSVMANGTGLNGHTSTTQSAVIIKLPGSANIYYVFTLGVSGSGSLNYSIVDMSLAAGNGSVTVKNVVLYSPSSEKMTAVQHCNGTDYWIVTHEYNTPNFRSYELTSAGVNTTPVITAIGPSYSGVMFCGNMKISPTGKKLGVALQAPAHSVHLYDFDNSTGVVSNSLSLGTYSNAYGCEFSPDGTKFYACREYGSGSNTLFQWDVCAPTATAIIASQYTLSVSSQIMGMQLGTDGKIYISKMGQAFLAVINNPNVAGAGCNYSHSGQSISPKTGTFNLPNFITSYFRAPPQPFTFTISCLTASFTSPYVPGLTQVGCSSTGYSLTSVAWSFGDPNSGSNNQSFANNPTHSFTGLGTFTVQQILYYSCGGGTDTLRQTVQINQSCISVNSSSITCANLGSATVSPVGGTGPFSFTWMPSGQTSSVATGLMPGTYVITVHDAGANSTYSASTVFTSLIPLQANFSNAASVACFGAANATASINNLTGGSGTYIYYWGNGAFTYTTANVNTLSAGLWSTTVTDALTSCSVSSLFFILQPPALTLNVSAASNSVCAGNQNILSAIASGGTPNYSYLWAGGANTFSQNVSQLTSGTMVYSVTVTDDNNCQLTNTISVDFIPNPVLTVPVVSICPLGVGTLVAVGANTYTWNNLQTGNTYTANPPVTTAYTVVGSAAGCSAATTATIYLLPVPVVTVSSNSPICNNQVLQLQSTSGLLYNWQGPLNFVSALQGPSVNAASPANSGAYNLTVTAANSCTASVTTSVTVHPTPTLSALGSTVCLGQNITVNATSFPGSVYMWNGPQLFSSSSQNNFIISNTVSQSGSYSVVATSVLGCTNSAVAHVTVTAAPTVSFSANGPLCSGSTLIFQSSVNINGAAFSWLGPNNFSSAIVHPTITSVGTGAAGVYTLTAVYGPCAVSVTQAVVIHALPTPAIITNAPVCENKTLHLDANIVYSQYQWSGPKNFYSSIKNPALTNVVQNQSGLHYLKVTDANGCEATTSVAVTVMANPIVSASSATVCLFEQATLTATGAVSYVWSGPWLSETDQPTVTASANHTAITQYFVIGTAANSCTGIAQANVETLALPIPSISLSKPRICLNSTITLEGSGGTHYAWHSPRNDIFSGKIITRTLTSLSEAGSYTLTVTDQYGCRSSTTSLVKIDDLPQGSMVSEKMDGCAPFCSEYNFHPTGSNSLSIAWQINNRQLDGHKFRQCFSMPGQYTVTALLADKNTTCKNKIPFFINAWPKPVANFSFMPVEPVENWDEVMFTNTSIGDDLTEFTWDIDLRDDGTHSSSTEHCSYLFQNAGVYPVVLTAKTSKGCIDTLIRPIAVLSDLRIYVPNAFTPNGDGRNDIFLPSCYGAVRYHMQIFNRWGTQIFESRSLEKGWDGSFNSEACPDGVYSWKIYLSSLKEDKELVGHVTLLR